MSSKNVGKIETPEYWITIGEWGSPITGVSYEVGCRRKSDGEFWLVASYLRTQKEAEAFVEEFIKEIPLVLNSDRSTWPSVWNQIRMKE